MFISTFNIDLLYHAVRNENIEIVKLLASHNDIDINFKNISIIFFTPFLLKYLDFV